jgi:hypothetical protein
MTHPLVTQLRFARSELVRGLEGLTPEEAIHRFEPMNCISWMIGHLANQEHFYWVLAGQGIRLAPELNDLVGNGKPASTPPLNEMWAVWKEVTVSADNYLESLTNEMLPTFITFNDKQLGENIGTMLQRNLYHYWFHIGEAMAVRQNLGHTNLPQFVGSFGNAVYKG